MPRLTRVFDFHRAALKIAEPRLPDVFAIGANQLAAVRRFWEGQHNSRSASDFALDCGGAAMKIDNRLYQGEAKASASRTAGRIGAIKPIKNTRQMFGSDSGTVIPD